MNAECPVTLIIPVYNVRDYIGELLQSITGQTFTNFRVLLGDDGSTDGTRTAVEPFLDDPRIEYLDFGANRGLGAVMKDLMGRVTTRYWCNPGGDDRLHPGFLEQRLAAAAEVDNPVLIHGTPRQIDSGGKEIHHFPVFELPRHLSSVTFLEVLLYHNVVNNPGVMVSTAHTRRCMEVMRTDLKYAPDWYWWILHSSLDGDVVFDPKPCMDYRYHAASLSGSTSKKWMRAEEVRRAPLIALYDAAKYSRTAAKLLDRYSRNLELMWGKRVVRVFLGSRGGIRLPQVPWMPESLSARMLKLACLALEASFHKFSQGDASGFTPSGYFKARHDCLIVHQPAGR